MTQTLSSPQPLDQWNTEQQNAWDDRRQAQITPEKFPNGLICPRDGGRLYDTGQEFLPTLSSPAKLRVKCMNQDCTFRGERLARIIRVAY